jgi:hypothetical protein
LYRHGVLARFAFALALALALPRAAYADEPAPADPCRESLACTRHGRCSSEGGRCVALDAADCAASSSCVEHGLRCELDPSAQRCGKSPSDAERLSQELPADGIDPWTRDLALGIVLTVLGIGGAVATPFVLQSAEDGDATVEAVGVGLSSFSSFAVGVTFITLCAYSPPRGTPSEWYGAGAAFRFRF